MQAWRGVRRDQPEYTPFGEVTDRTWLSTPPPKPRCVARDHIKRPFHQRPSHHAVDGSTTHKSSFLAASNVNEHPPARPRSPPPRSPPWGSPGSTLTSLAHDDPLMTFASRRSTPRRPPPSEGSSMGPSPFQASTTTPSKFQATTRSRRTGSVFSTPSGDAAPTWGGRPAHSQHGAQRHGPPSRSATKSSGYGQTGAGSRVEEGRASQSRSRSRDRTQRVVNAAPDAARRPRKMSVDMRLPLGPSGGSGSSGVGGGGGGGGRRRTSPGRSPPAGVKGDVDFAAYVGQHAPRSHLQKRDTIEVQY